MKRNSLILLVLILGVLLTAGCSAPQGAMIVDDSVALAQFGPVESLDDAAPGVFYLGAGDALGYAIFVNYVAYVRANPDYIPHYATADVEPELAK